MLSLSNQKARKEPTKKMEQKGSAEMVTTTTALSMQRTNGSSKLNNSPSLILA